MEIALSVVERAGCAPTTSATSTPHLPPVAWPALPTPRRSSNALDAARRAAAATSQSQRRWYHNLRVLGSAAPVCSASFTACLRGRKTVRRRAFVSLQEPVQQEYPRSPQSLAVARPSPPPPTPSVDATLLGVLYMGVSPPAADLVSSALLLTLLLCPSTAEPLAETGSSPSPSLQGWAGDEEVAAVPVVVTPQELAAVRPRARPPLLLPLHLLAAAPPRSPLLSAEAAARIEAASHGCDSGARRLRAVSRLALLPGSRPAAAAKASPPPLGISPGTAANRKRRDGRRDVLGLRLLRGDAERGASEPVASAAAAPIVPTVAAAELYLPEEEQEEMVEGPHVFFRSPAALMCSPFGSDESLQAWGTERAFGTALTNVVIA